MDNISINGKFIINQMDSSFFLFLKFHNRKIWDFHPTAFPTLFLGSYCSLT